MVRWPPVSRREERLGNTRHSRTTCQGSVTLRVISHREAKQIICITYIF